jgi:hypothetical protein
MGVNTLRSNGHVHSDRLTRTYYPIDILRLKDFSLYIGSNTTSSASPSTLSTHHRDWKSLVAARHE